MKAKARKWSLIPGLEIERRNDRLVLLVRWEKLAEYVPEKEVDEFDLSKLLGGGKITFRKFIPPSAV